MDRNFTADTQDGIVVIKTDNDKKFCEGREKDGRMVFVSDQGQVEALDFLKQAFGKSNGRQGKRRK